MILKIACLLYLLVISIFDLRTERIPNSITLGFFTALLLLDIFTAPSKIPHHLLSAILFFAIFFLIALLTKGLGMGDAKLAATLGYGFGFFKTALILTCACVAGIAGFLIFKLLKRTLTKLPFAPLVTIGYVISQLFCRRIL